MAVGLGVLGAWAPATANHAAFVAPDADFADAAAQSGLNFKCQHWHKNMGLGARWFTDILFCASPALGDFNGDGYTDLYFPNSRYNAPPFNAAENPQDALYLNNGDGTFSDASSFVGISDPGFSMGAAAFDYDDDGDLDVYVANYPETPPGFNALNSPATTFYRNNGDGSFTRATPPGLVTESLFGFPDRQMGMSVAVADYDHDGDLDLYRGNYIQYDMRRLMPAQLQLTIPDTNNFYENNGDGTFTDRTLAKGASVFPGRTFSVNFADFDGDTWPDLFVANDENPDEFYLNRPDGAGGRTFEEFSAGSGANDPRGAMCSEPADFDNDGDLDLYFSHYEDENNGYYLNNGDGTFANAETLGDLEVRSFHLLQWGCPSLDYDNDGDLDLFVASGHMVPSGGEFFHVGDPNDDNGFELPNVLYRNTLRDTGVHSWTDVSNQAGPGLADRFVSSGAMSADFDLDGNVEVVVVNNNDQPVNLYRNRAVGNGHWLQVELEGVASNSHGIGAQVEASIPGLVQTRQMITGESLASGSAAPLRFGLGGYSGTVDLTVTWPSGLVQTETVGADQPVRVVEGVGVELDTLAPRVTAALAGLPGLNGWWKSPTVDVTLTAADRGIGSTSGVASVSFRLDGGPVQPYTGTFTVAGEGVHKLTVYTTDAAGNTAWYPRFVRIDSVAPTALLLKPEAAKVYYQDRVLGASPTGETIIVAPAKTPNEPVRDLDFLVAETIKQLGRELGTPLPQPPTNGTQVLNDTVGSDGRTSVEVSAADTVSGVARVEFRLDGSLRVADAAAPYQWRADLRGMPVGEHCITTSTFDRAGWETSAPIRVVVIPSTQDGAMNSIMDQLGQGGGC